MTKVYETTTGVFAKRFSICGGHSPPLNFQPRALTYDPSRIFPKNFPQKFSKSNPVIPPLHHTWPQCPEFSHKKFLTEQIVCDMLLTTNYRRSRQRS
nr:MAG TPA: hypothetical protein [Caudoviricetes sp.]